MSISCSAEPPDTLPERLGALRREIAEAAAAAGRPAGAVTLMAVSKTQPVERLLKAIEAGQRCFGENRVQEAAVKWPELRPRAPGLELHLIGPLQTNKVRAAVALFDVIETVDRESVAEALGREMERQGRRLPCYVQINTGEEPTKAGIPPTDADAFIERCRTGYGLPVVGLMCIPPVEEDPAPHFALLAQTARRHGLAGLSMGMSADFPVAIRFGATIVRVGTALFGARPMLAAG